MAPLGLVAIRALTLAVEFLAKPILAETVLATLNRLLATKKR